MPGFIHDKLEVRILILYIVSRLVESVPVETILDLALCDDGVNYFEFMECLNDLVDTRHLTCSMAGRYSITEKGIRNCSVCESELPYSVRLKCDRNIAECNRRLRRKRQVRSSWEKRPNGTWTVRLVLDDDAGNVMDLHLVVLREDMAKAVAARFEEKPELVHTRLMDFLLDDSQWEKPPV